MSRFLPGLIAILLALLLASAPGLAQARGPLVLAAASLQESLNAAADGWAAKGHPRPVVSFASTAALARQVEAGAPADLFVSADEEWMDYLATRRLIRQETRVCFLTNRLVLVTAASRPLRLAVRPGFPLARALGAGRLAMADFNSVPAGKYGREALMRLGVWPSVAQRVVLAENVRAALVLVGRNEAPLGIAYATDALADARVRVAGTFPPSSHKPIRYPLAVLASSTHPDAEGFRRYLLSVEGKATFRRFGFGTL